MPLRGYCNTHYAYYSHNSSRGKCTLIWSLVLFWMFIRNVSSLYSLHHAPRCTKLATFVFPLPRCFSRYIITLYSLTEDVFPLTSPSAPSSDIFNTPLNFAFAGRTVLSSCFVPSTIHTLCHEAINSLPSNSAQCWMLIMCLSQWHVTDKTDLGFKPPHWPLRVTYMQHSVYKQDKYTITAFSTASI